MITTNKHIPVLLDEIKKFIPKSKKINVIDATFGAGGYSKEILENYDIDNLFAIDRDPYTKNFANPLTRKFNNFSFINGCFSEIDILLNQQKKIKNKNFDIILFDLGVSSNQLEDAERGFSFNLNGPLNMRMGNSDIDAKHVINTFSEEKLTKIFFEFGEEKFSKKIARNIVKFRKLKIIDTTSELSELIKKSIPKFKNKKSKINPATKTFQALRIYVNDELNEIKMALNKSSNLLKKDGKIIVVSFQSLEDRIVKDFFNHISGKRWRSSRHYPELAEEGPITFKLITKKPIRPNEQELKINPRSRSAKLRIAQKIN